MLLCKTRVPNTMHITNAWGNLTLESQKPPICSLTANFYLWCNAERHRSIGNRWKYNNLGSRNHRFLYVHWKQTNITWMSKLLHSRMSRWSPYKEWGFLHILCSILLSYHCKFVSVLECCSPFESMCQVPASSQHSSGCKQMAWHKNKIRQLLKALAHTDMWHQVQFEHK